MKTPIFQCGYLHTDDTPARMLKPDNGKTVEVRMWAYEAAEPNAPPYIIYDFSVDHKYEHPVNFMKNFRMYLDDPNIKIDNNSGERAIRKVVIGKKNWMFVGSPKAGESMAILYSFVQSCRAINIDPHKNLMDVFKRLNSHPHKNLTELLPVQWKITNN